MQSAAPVETLERRGFPQELGKVSMNNSRLSHTLHSADGDNLNETLHRRAFESVLRPFFDEFHPLQTRKSHNPIRSEPQEKNRFRFWAVVPELENRYLRVVTLDEK